MKPATDLRAGMVIRLSGETFRVLEAEYHAGGGKMHGAVHARLRRLDSPHFTERRFRPDERFEELPLERRPMQFLYADADDCTFMDPESYEQVTISREAVGPFQPFLAPEQTLQVEFLEGEPVNVIAPADVTLRVEAAPEPLHGHDDSNVFKAATLENGMEVQVPQFIKTGDLVKISVESGKYLERVK
jgi:elongation factor P